jgi:fibronectin-binding autotransporter adhesin
MRLLRTITLLGLVALMLMTAALAEVRVKETQIDYYNGSKWVKMTRGAVSAFVSASTSLATLAVGGGYASTGLTIGADGVLTGASTALFDGVITSGKTGSNGGLAVKSTGAGATTFSVAGATGNTVVVGTLDVTGATTITGALTANGGISCDSGAFAVANTTGKITGTAEADIALNTNMFTVDATQGNTVIAGTANIAGAATLSNALTVAGLTDLNGALEVANTSTLSGNVAAGGTLSVASTTSLTGLLTATGGLYTGTGYAATGATISAAGVGEFDGALSTLGALTADNIVCTNAATFGGGSGGSGATITTLGAGTFDALLTANGGIAVDTDNFTVDGTTGATVVQSTIVSGVASTTQGGVTIHGGTSGAIAITPTAAGTNTTTLINSSGGSAKDITLPAVTGTLAILGANIFTAAQEIDAGFTVDDTNFTVHGTTGAVATLADLTVGTTSALKGIVTMGDKAHAGILAGSGILATPFSLGATSAKGMSFYFSGTSETATHALEGLYVNVDYGVSATAVSPFGEAGRFRARLIGDASSGTLTGSHSTVEMVAGSTNTALTLGARGNVIFANEVVGGGGTYAGVQAELNTGGAATDLRTGGKEVSILRLVIDGTAPTTPAQFVVPAISLRVPSTLVGAGLIFDNTASANTVTGKLKILVNGVEYWVMCAAGHD